MKIPAVLAVAATAVLTLSACGLNSTALDRAAPVNADTAGLHVATTPLGKVVVDASGCTVYLLTADSRNHSTCASACLQFWPAVTAGGHAGVTAQVGATATPDGTKTATVGGHPVYTFSQDHAPGDVNGEGLQEFGGTWYAVSPTGAAIAAAGSSTSPSPSSSSSSAPGAPPAHGGGGY